jgi:hypothetical protein
MTTTATHTTDIPQMRGEVFVCEAAVGVEECIATNELAVGDTMIVSGLPTGNTRRVLEVRIIEGAAYIRTVSGWFRFRHVYIHVATPKPAPTAAAKAAAPAAPMTVAEAPEGGFVYPDDFTYPTDPATLVGVQVGDRINVFRENDAWESGVAEVTSIGSDQFGFYFHGRRVVDDRATRHTMYASNITHRITPC